MARQPTQRSDSRNRLVLAGLDALPGDPGHHLVRPCRHDSDAKDDYVLDVLAHFCCRSVINAGRQLLCWSAKSQMALTMSSLTLCTAVSITKRLDWRYQELRMYRCVQTSDFRTHGLDSSAAKLH